MIQRKSTFFLGVFIIIIPFLGVPSSWRAIFIVFSGILLIILSLRISLPKKPVRNKTRREKITPVFVESIPAYPKENSVDGISAPAQTVKTEEKDISVNL